MLLLVLLYIVLLVIFFAISAIIINHSRRLGKLVPHYRAVMGFFGLISIIIIAISLYFLLQVGDDSPKPANPITAPASSGSSDLQF